MPHGYDLAIESDSTVRGESRWQGILWHPIEMKTRILAGYDDWERVVPKALEIVKYLGGRVNVSTGFQCHLSFEEVCSQPNAIKSLFNTMHKFDGVIFGMLAPTAMSV